MLIIIGSLAGMFFVGVQLLQEYGYVSMVNWDKLGNDTSTQIQVCGEAHPRWQSYCRRGFPGRLMDDNITRLLHCCFSV